MPGPYGATDGGKLVMRAGCAGGIYAAPTDNPLGEWLRWVHGMNEFLAYAFKIKGM